MKTKLYDTDRPLTMVDILLVMVLAAPIVLLAITFVSTADPRILLPALVVGVLVELVLALATWQIRQPRKVVIRREDGGFINEVLLHQLKATISTPDRVTLVRVKNGVMLVGFTDINPDKTDVGQAELVARFLNGRWARDAQVPGHRSAGVPTLRIEVVSDLLRWAVVDVTPGRATYTHTTFPRLRRRPIKAIR